MYMCPPIPIYMHVDVNVCDCVFVYVVVPCARAFAAGARNGACLILLTDGRITLARNAYMTAALAPDIRKCALRQRRLTRTKEETAHSIGADTQLQVSTCAKTQPCVNAKWPTARVKRQVAETCKIGQVARQHMAKRPEGSRREGGPNFVKSGG